MAGPDYGALGATFKSVRVLQVISLISIIGMTANFISEMVNSNKTPPQVLIGTLSVTCIAVLYCVITYILFLDNSLPFLIHLAMDGLLLIALVVVAVVIGKPLSYLNCQVIGSTSAFDSAYDYTAALGSGLDKSGTSVVYTDWIAATKTTCLEMKAIWGLSIALCILFAFSGICSVCLWRRNKAATSKSSKV